MYLKNNVAGECVERTPYEMSTFAWWTFHIILHSAKDAYNARVSLNVIGNYIKPEKLAKDW